MIVTTDIRSLSGDAGSVVTIGKFDGVHRGHQKLIREMLADSAAGLRSVVVTMEPSPQAFLAGRTDEVLTLPEEKERLLLRLGVDVWLRYPFSEQTREMTAEDFLTGVLVGGLGARKIAAGPDCRFGFRGQGDVGFLASHQACCGYELTVVEKELWHGEPISSSRIRACLETGDPVSAGAMLGYPYSVEGTVVHGRGIGSARLGRPTINIRTAPEKILPRGGVYVSRVLIGNRAFDGMTNVGRKPTVADGLPVGVETSVFSFDENVYDQTVRVEFLEFVRPEQKFSGLEELRAQLMRDEEEVKRRLKKRKT